MQQSISMAEKEVKIVILGEAGVGKSGTKAAANLHAFVVDMHGRGSPSLAADDVYL